MNLILASSSPRRKELLERLNTPFIIKFKDINEEFNSNLSVEENVKLVALKKAKAVYEDSDSVIIGCDTIVVLNNKVYGKPKDNNDAYNMLKTFSGVTHEVISGVAILYKDIVKNFYVKSYVTFKELTDKEILDYIDTKECLDKAGSYAIQGIGAKLVKEYSGELENIIGLPIKEVKEVLEEIYGI